MPIGFTLDQALRLEEAIRSSGKKKAEICRKANVRPSVLSNVTGTKALSSEDVHRPMMGAKTFVEICLDVGANPEHVLGYSDQVAPALRAYRDELPAVVERMYEEIVTQVTTKLSYEGIRPTTDDILQWWHQTGGEIGKGADIEEHFDVVHKPGPDATYVEPYRLGAHSLSSRRLGSSDPELLSNIVRGWPKDVRMHAVEGYHAISKAQTGPTFTGTAMTAYIGDEVIEYCALRLDAKHRHKSTPLAICFAVEWRRQPQPAH